MPTALLHLLHSLGQPHVLVLGDLMLDRYIWGDVPRISPEAPVPVLRVDRTEERLGGAASVAGLLTALGASVALAGVLGDDGAGQRVRQLLQGQGIETMFVVADPSRPSTVKERYLGRAQHKYPQQVLRVDYETERELASEFAERLAAACVAQLSACSIVLISDYGKGVCTASLLGQLIASARRHGLCVLVDPAPQLDWQRYRGCQLLIPNRREATRVVGHEIADVESAFRAAEVLRERFGLEAGLVKLDREGIVLTTSEEQRQYPALERQVYDITGAGDTVLAVLGLVLADGRSLEEAVRLAIVAAGLQVERVGVCPITREDMLADVKSRLQLDKEKLLPLDALLLELANARKAGKRIAFTNGCFDLLHPGHVHVLREARRQADILVVGLNADASVRRLKGKGRPIQDEQCRAHVLSGLSSVDYICLFAEDTPEELVRALRPDVMVKGADYRPEQIAGWKFLEANGSRLHLVPLLAGQSTTAIATRLQESKPPVRD